MDDNAFLRRVRSIAGRIRRDADLAGMTPYDYAKEQDPADNKGDRLLFISAASIAQVEYAYDASPDNRDLARVFFMPCIAEWMKDLKRRGMPLEACVGEFTSAYHYIHFKRTGSHLYRVSDGLAANLAMTELRGIKCNDLRLPYPCLYLEFPESLGFRVHNNETGWHPADGVYIAEDNTDSGIKYGEVTPGRSWRLCVVSKPYTLADGSTPLEDSAHSFFSMCLVDDTMVDQAISLLRSDRGSPSSRSPSEVDMNNWIQIWRWVMNVMVYATTPDAEADHIIGNPDAASIWRRIQKLPKGKKRDALREKLKSMDRQEACLLGNSVRYTPSLKEMFEHYRDHGAGKPLAVRTLVAGHYQGYWTGTGGDKTKVWKYKLPYWKGPDGAPIAASTEHRM